MKARFKTFPLGVHAIIDDASPAARIKGHELAIELIRRECRPEVGPIVSIDPNKRDEVGVRVMVLASRSEQERERVRHAFCDAAMIVGLEFE